MPERGVVCGSNGGGEGVAAATVAAMVVWVREETSRAVAATAEARAVWG